MRIKKNSFAHGWSIRSVKWPTLITIRVRHFTERTHVPIRPCCGCRSPAEVTAMNENLGNVSWYTTWASLGNKFSLILSTRIGHTCITKLIDNPKIKATKMRWKSVPHPASHSASQPLSQSLSQSLKVTYQFLSPLKLQPPCHPQHQIWSHLHYKTHWSSKN